ncbi:uncharacterized protein LOC130894105 [Diorhabda carinulata]|uniref:uncharacterized protein LOC130447041 n=1 Tax=Diorhabda sublineata TaxID=1163346 RepID=UPI0024E0B58A|nr:uncharacterized protein LOC130447041 [Diorhabda sublineata]XP_057656677.1 uncharacterized protein LOC130894105 [Diorhabda carinulata]
MAKLVILFACFAVFNAVSALDCYTCDTETCKKEMKLWDKFTCGKVADQSLEAVCQKVVFKDKDGKEGVQRKCVTVPKTGNDNNCPTIPGATDIKCTVCKTDLCNSAATVKFSLTAVVGIFLAFLGQKYLL